MRSAAFDPAAPHSADEWLAAARSALRLTEWSGETPDAALTSALFTTLLRGGACEEAVEVLVAGGLGHDEVKGLTTRSLKQLITTPCTEASEAGHWELLRALQSRGMAGVSHHTVVLHGCNSREEVQRVLQMMSAGGIEGDGMLYSALHTVLTSWGDSRAAVAAMAEADGRGVWTAREISATATNTLRRLGEGGGRSRKAAWRYFEALLLHELCDRYHLHTMLGLCEDSAQAEKVLAQLLTGSRDEPGGEVEPHDELTYELVNKMWIRLGDVERASAILAEGHAACGWGRKKLRRKVYGTLLRLYDEAEADAERAEEAERLHLKAVAYFCALHGRGLTDKQSCRLALRRCRDAAERAELRQEVEAAGLGS